MGKGKGGGKNLSIRKKGAKENNTSLIDWYRNLDIGLLDRFKINLFHFYTSKEVGCTFFKTLGIVIKINVNLNMLKRCLYNHKNLKFSVVTLLPSDSYIWSSSTSNYFNNPHTCWCFYVKKIIFTYLSYQRLPM